jgi:hypothetical protein
MSAAEAKRPGIAKLVERVREQSGAPFGIVCDMEDDSTAASELVDVLILMCPALEEDGNTMLAMSVALTIKCHLESIEERRGKLFRMMHPNREVPLVRENLRRREEAAS